MKIKNQISLLIAGIIIIPIFCLILFPLNAYFNSPRHFLMADYNEIKDLNELQLSDDDWENIEELIKKIPPEVQFLIYYNSQVVFSNIPEISSGTVYSGKELFDFIRQTADVYDYQLHLKNRSLDKNIPESETELKELIITRYNSAESKRYSRLIYRYFPPLFFIILFLEFFVITVIIFIAKSVSNSIQVIQKVTRKIANGELDTDIKFAEKSSTNEILELTKDLDSMRNSLKEEQERRSRFIMGISHDLHTPVAIIKGYSEAISDGVVNDIDGIKKSAAIINTKSEQLESMIKELIDYVKLNNVEWKKIQEPVEIKSFLEDFVANMEGVAEFYKRKIFKSIDLDEQFVLMDKNLFIRVLENLYRNALQYTNDGDSISLEARKNNQGLIEISIRDTGIGIPEDDLKKVFELFYRSTNSRREDGTGIGLSVVKSIIDSHGWQISVDSEVGKGSVFTITMS